MLNGRLIWVAWLLSAAIAAASLDSVPDPPAIKQRIVQSQSADSTEQLDHAVDNAWQRGFETANLRLPAHWTALREARKSACAVRLSPLMRQASDPSPPALAL
jgi:hypothetical protein